LFRTESLKQLKLELETYIISTAAIHKISWKGAGIMDTGHFTMFYSGSTQNNTFGSGFLVNNKYNPEVNFIHSGPSHW
jgi:hypothetical protein